MVVLVVLVVDESGTTSNFDDIWGIKLLLFRLSLVVFISITI